MGFRLASLDDAQPTETARAGHSLQALSTPTLPEVERNSSPQCTDEETEAQGLARGHTAKVAEPGLKRWAPHSQAAALSCPPWVSWAP